MRGVFLMGGIIFLFLFSCARMDQREARYDPRQCPFCTSKPAICFYCGGTGKCSYCKGSGTRTTVSPDMWELGLKKSQYTEKCPFCGGKAACRHCEGKGKCWACEGSGNVARWDFFQKHQRMTEAGASFEAGQSSAAKGM